METLHASSLFHFICEHTKRKFHCLFLTTFLFRWKPKLVETFRKNPSFCFIVPHKNNLFCQQNFVNIRYRNANLFNLKTNFWLNRQSCQIFCLVGFTQYFYVNISSVVWQHFQDFCSIHTNSRDFWKKVKFICRDDFQ